MPGRISDPGNALVPLSPHVGEPVIYPLHHGVKPPFSGLSISWSRGNSLRVTFFKTPIGGGEEDGSSGKVVEVKLPEGGIEIEDAQKRRIAYGSVTAFAVLQSKRDSVSTMPRISLGSSSYGTEWWQHVMEFSKHISSILGSPKNAYSSVAEDPKIVLKSGEEPTYLKAAWELMEIFYVDKESRSWLQERLVDWLADYDCLLSQPGMTVHSTLLNLQNELVNVQVIEDEKKYWEGMSSALAIGWNDIVVKLLRLHGSYKLDQLGAREIENGLVEAVACLVSTMPRMRPVLAAGKLGTCHKTKPDFTKAWEKWRSQLARLDCSSFWVQCGHRKTREGLKNMLQVMMGNTTILASWTHHWLELCISHFLFVRPFTMGLEGMLGLAQICIQLKPVIDLEWQTGLLFGILEENIEVVLAECSRVFGPWMVTHVIELLTADNAQAVFLLHEERYNLGGISIEELHRIVYAQLLSSHALTWQIAPVYLASCPKQGMGLLKILLYMEPVQRDQTLLKSLEICRLYELDNLSSCLGKIAGMHSWKHGRLGSGVFWLQHARDVVKLNRIAQKLFEHVGKSISDDSFKQWEGLIELLGCEASAAGGLEFLHNYRDFKRSLWKVQGGRDTAAARLAVESLIQLMKNPSTPQRFWLPLLHDSLILLNWREHPLLNVSETNLLLSKLQELSLAKLHPGFSDAKMPSHALSSVRLALATNLGRAFLEYDT